MGLTLKFFGLYIYLNIYVILYKLCIKSRLKIGRDGKNETQDQSEDIKTDNFD